MGVECSAQRPYLLPAVESRQEKAGKMQIGHRRNIGRMIYCSEREMAVVDRYLPGGRREAVFDSLSDNLAERTAGKDRDE